MITPGSDIKIYLSTGFTDMRKGANSLSMLAENILRGEVFKRAMFVFRGKRADKIKILWWDGQGFCMYYKCFDRGKFIWPKSDDKGTVGITRAQLSMLLEGVDWRNPKWSDPPIYAS